MMTMLKEMIFIDVIALQSEIALRAGERLQATKDNYNKIEVWSSIQSILTAAGIVSKILCDYSCEVGSVALLVIC